MGGFQTLLHDPGRVAGAARSCIHRAAFRCSPPACGGKKTEGRIQLINSDVFVLQDGVQKCVWIDTHGMRRQEDRRGAERARFDPCSPGFDLLVELIFKSWIFARPMTSRLSCLIQRTYSEVLILRAYFIALNNPESRQIRWANKCIFSRIDGWSIEAEHARSR